MKRCKASILTKKANDKSKEISTIDESIAEKLAQKEVIRESVEKFQKSLEQQSEHILQIGRHIQQATGLEQETLHTHVANLKAELEGLRVREESYENRKGELARRLHEVQKSIPALEHEIEALKNESPLMAQKAEELREKKKELAILEEERKRLVACKAELATLRERIKEKERNIARIAALSETYVRQMEEHARSLTYAAEPDCRRAVLATREALASHKRSLEQLRKEEIQHERQASVSEAEKARAEKITLDVSSLETCPLCQSSISEEHRNNVAHDSNEKILSAETIIKQTKKSLHELHERRHALQGELRALEEKLSIAEVELIKHGAMKEKQEQLKKTVEEEQSLREEIAQLEKRREALEDKTIDFSKIDEHYERTMLEIEEISSRTEEDTNTALLYKGRDLEGMHNIVRRTAKDIEELEHQIQEIRAGTQEKQSILKKKEQQERELQAKFKKLFEERDALQTKIQEQNLALSESQNEMRAIEDQVNYLKIGKAKLDAEREALQMELTEFVGIELLQGSLQVLEERLKKTQEAVQGVGSINMRALEVYEDVKKEYDLVEQKVATLDKEKQEILAIIAEIDQKKKRSFMKTFRAMNALFSSNFSKLSSKGVAFLELENQDELFSGGVNIVVKLAKGKYFDVTSLSGGEQTIVALSLLFAIQEYKPYHFYVFDEIDAALDKRNSERLAVLLNQYMKSGQYIVITHNDAIIMNSNILYGVSMHDGVSKVLSLNVNGTVQPVTEQGFENQALVASMPSGNVSALP